MRAAPAFQVSLRRFAVWRTAVFGLFVFGAAILMRWWFARDAPHGGGLPAAAIAALVALSAAAHTLWRTAPADLRWDGVCWHLMRPGNEGLEGSISVAIDLGAWMLLRFAPASTTGPTQVIWLPAQRRGIEADWHALRCAVHSPHPSGRRSGGPGA
jgi:hypothetical protein